LTFDQEFAVHIRLQDGQVISVRTFLAWQEAVEAVGLSE
jgi:ketosteroid isomerase-like protein